MTVREVNSPHQKRPRWLKAGLTTSVGAAFAASLCCLGPALFIAAGGIVTASEGSFFEKMTAARPVFVLVSLGFLYAGYHYTFNSIPSTESCETGVCTPRNPINRTVFTVTAVIVLALLTSPYWLGLFA